MSVTDATKRLKISSKTVRRMTAGNKLPGGTGWIRRTSTVTGGCR